MKKLLFPLALAAVCSFEGTAGAAVVDVAANVARADGKRLQPGASLTEGSAISTGGKAKLQLSLGNRGGVARAGSKTEAVLASEGNLALRKGVMLTSSGGAGLGRESISVDTPETRATVKGTMLIAYQPGAYIKITCLEGKVTIRMKALLGEIINLTAGQMVIINPAEESLPEVVEVDLRELAATSAMLGNGFPPLAARSAVDNAANRQERAMESGALAETNLRMEGASPALFLDRGIEGQREEEEETPEDTPPSVARSNNSGREREGAHSPPPPPPPPPPEGYIIDDTTVFTPETLTTPGFHTVEGVWDRVDGPPPFASLAYHFPATGTDTVELLFRRNSLIPGNASADEIAYHVEGRLQIGDGLPTVVTVDTVMMFLADQLRIDNATVQTTGDTGAGLSFFAREMEILDSTLYADSSLGVYGNERVSIVGSELNGVDEVYVYGGRGVGIANSEILSLGEISVGSGIVDGPEIVSVSGSSLVSSNGTINLYSYHRNPEIDAIVVNDSRLDAGQDILIGGGEYTAGISLTGAELTAAGNVYLSSGLDAGAADAGTVSLSATRVTANGGDIHVNQSGANTSRAGIIIRNSSELRALAAAGNLYLTTSGARVVVEDSLLQAGSNGGQILIDTMARNQRTDSLVTLTNVTANADVIRARAFNSADRDALLINGGNFSAASQIKFYAEGASRLRFTGDVRLNAPDSVLAGKIVQVDAGGNVTGSGRVTVYSDDHRYNTSGYGNIRANGGSGSAQSRSHAERPGF